MPAKRPAARSVRSKPTGKGDDPRYISQARGTSKRAGIPIPKANPKWLPEARDWYNSLAQSGQSELYEASDWATAVATAKALDIFYRTYNASILAVFERLSKRLGVTVIDRQQSRIELPDPEAADLDEDAADAAVGSWQTRLSAVPD